MNYLVNFAKLLPVMLVLALFEFNFLFDRLFYQRLISGPFFDLWTLWHMFLGPLAVYGFIKFQPKKLLYVLILLPLLFYFHDGGSLLYSDFYYLLTFYLLPFFGALGLLRLNVIKGSRIPFTVSVFGILLLILIGVFVDLNLFDFLGRLAFPYVDVIDISKPTSANWLASLLAFLCLLSLEYDKFSIFKCVMLAFAFVLILLTQSYGAIVGLLCGLCYFALKSRTLCIKRFFAGIVMFLLVVSPFLYKTQKFQILLGNYHKPNSIERRIQIYKVSYDLIKENFWFGIGVNNFKSKFISSQGMVLTEPIPENELPPHPHNALLFFMLEFGIVGLFIYFFWIFRLYRYRLSAASFYFLVHSLIDMPFLTFEHSFLFWLTLLI